MLEVSCGLLNRQVSVPMPSDWRQILSAFCPSSQGKARLLLPDGQRYSFSYEALLSPGRYLIGLQSTWASEVSVEISIHPNGVSIREPRGQQVTREREMLKFLTLLGPFLFLLERHQQGQAVCDQGICQSYQPIQTTFQGGDGVQLATDDYVLEGRGLEYNFFRKIVFRSKSLDSQAQMELFPTHCHSFPD